MAVAFINIELRQTQPFIGPGRKLVFVLPQGLGITSLYVPYFPGKTSKGINKSIVSSKLPFLCVPPRQGSLPHAHTSGLCVALGLAQRSCTWLVTGSSSLRPPLWLDFHRLGHTFPGGARAQREEHWPGGRRGTWVLVKTASSRVSLGKSLN